MILQKTIKTLKTLSEEDWNDIQVWSQSPIYILRKNIEKRMNKKKNLAQIHYLGTKEEILIIFDLIFEKKDQLNIIDIQIFENAIFEKIKPLKKNYTKSSFDRRLGELNNNFIEKYIGLKLISNGASETRWQLQTLRYLSENKLLYQYDILQNKIENKLSGIHNTSLDLYNLFLFQKNNLGHSVLQCSNKVLKTDLLSSSITLQNYFFLEIAFISTAILNKNILYNTNLENIDLKEKIAPELLKNNNFLKLVYDIYLIQEIVYNGDYNNEIEKIYAKIVLIIQELKQIEINKLSSTIEIKSIYFLLLTITKTMTENDYPKFSTLYFDIINYLIDTKLILQRNNINIYLLKSITEMSIQFNRLENVKTFILDLIKNKTLIKFILPKEEAKRIKRIKALSFNQKVLLYIEALFLFSAKDYKASFDLLKNLRYTGQNRFDIDVDKLKIKLLHELEDKNELEDTDLYSKKLKSSNKKFNDDDINLPYKQKEKMLAFIAILSSNKTKDSKFFKTVFKRKPLSVMDKKWLSEKYNFKMQN